jgi:hypothetical protein
MRKATAVLMLAACVVAVPGLVSAQPSNSINLLGTGLVGPDILASVIGVEYERLLNDNMSIMGRFAKLDYEVDDGEYEEDGDGTGFDVGVRFYPSGSGMRGFFLGGNLGVWRTDWTWIDDKGTVFATAGKGSTDSFKVEFEIGGRIPLGTEIVSLVPAARLGSFVGQDSTCKNYDGSQCSQGTDTGFYVLLGLSLGIAF